jgi:hypothetical protein
MLPSDTGTQVLEHFGINDHRIVKIVAHQIMSIIQSETLVAKLDNFRVEKIPTDQIEISETDILLPCAFSSNQASHATSCVFTPFFLKVGKDEAFVVTESRLLSLFEQDFGPFQYILIADNKNIHVQESMRLADYRHQRILGLYIILDMSYLTHLYGTQPLKIES